MKLDVMDAAALRTAIKGSDVIGNFVGPFFRYAAPVLGATIEAGKPYVDICDDVEPTLDLLETYNEQAMTAGVTAVIGMGASPGMLNIFARRGADLLEAVHDIQLFWNVSVNDISADLTDPKQSTAIYEHALALLASDTLQYIEGKLQRVEAGSGIQSVEFPQLGNQPVYFVSHPEPVTIPRYISAKNVTNKGGVLGLNDTLFKLRSLGLVSHGNMTIAGRQINIFDVAVGVMRRLALRDEVAALEEAPPCSDSMAVVSGISEGKKVAWQLSYQPTAGLPRMDEATGVTAALGILMLGRGEVKITGVHAPEGCIDPLRYIEMLRSEGLLVKEVKLTVNP